MDPAMPTMPCLFCGGDRSDPRHDWRCDGRQGELEALAAVEELPRLISGLTPETWDTSAAAAASIEDTKESQRLVVEATIRAAGRDGRTDDEVQVLLDLDGSSERPRRWELWRLGRIEMLRAADGTPVRRLTRSQRRAVVWVTAEFVTRHPEVA